MGATEVLPDDAKSIAVSPDTPDSPFSPPYRTDTYIEHKLVQLQSPVRMRLEACVQTMHQDALMKLVRKVHSCPEPIPRMITLDCPPSHTEQLRSERIHAVLQLLLQIRESQHQAQLRKAYKTYGSNQRKAAKELYAREQFTIAYVQYWSMFACLSCDKCRKMPSAERHSLSVDLLEKLAVTCLRAGWLADAENFASEALDRENRSTRARIWLATAQLGLGKLDLARKNLVMLPRPGQFPAEFPPWIEARVLAQREVLARLEQESRGVFNLPALELDPPDCTPATPHSTAMFHIEATPAGYRTIARVAKGALLLVAAPVACAPCYTADFASSAATETAVSHENTASSLDTLSPRAQTEGHLPPIPQDDDPNSLFSLALIANNAFEQAKVQSPSIDTASEPSSEPARQPMTLHEEDPSLLSVALITDTLYMQAKVLPFVRFPLRAAAARCRKESEKVIDIVGNELRAAAIIVAQNYTLSIPHAHSVTSSVHRNRASDDAWTDLPCEKPVHAGHALYMPALKLLSSVLPNTYATFHGPYLFLRAKTDLRAGTLLTFSGFPGPVAPPPINTSSRGRVTALASSPPALSPASPPPTISKKSSYRAARPSSS